MLQKQTPLTSSVNEVAQNDSKRVIKGNVQGESVFL